MLSHTAPTDPPTATPAAETVPKVEEKDETPPAPRLVIDKMVLKNFKSYAGRVEIGPFHKVGIVLRAFTASTRSTWLI